MLKMLLGARLRLGRAEHAARDTAACRCTGCANAPRVFPRCARHLHARANRRLRHKRLARAHRPEQHVPPGRASQDQRIHFFLLLERSARPGQWPGTRAAPLRGPHSTRDWDRAAALSCVRAQLERWRTGHRARVDLGLSGCTTQAMQHRDVSGRAAARRTVPGLDPVERRALAPKRNGDLDHVRLWRAEHADRDDEHVPTACGAGAGWHVRAGGVRTVGKLYGH